MSSATPSTGPAPLDGIDGSTARREPPALPRLMRHQRCGGTYLRVADPAWSKPLATRYSRAAGGRWNPPGSFGAVYLNATLAVARAQVTRKLEPRGIHPEDLRPERGPTLIHTEVPEDSLVDAVSDRGLESLGLPTTYPRDVDGSEVPHATCQPLGHRAWEEGESGIACRSAAADPSPGEELTHFARNPLRVTAHEPFSAWFWPSP